MDETVDNDLPRRLITEAVNDVIRVSRNPGRQKLVHSLKQLFRSFSSNKYKSFRRH